MNRTNFLVTFLIALFAIPALQNTQHRSARQNDLPEKFTKTTRVRFTVDVAITMMVRLMLHLADMNQGSNRNEENA